MKMSGTYRALLSLICIPLAIGALTSPAVAKMFGQVELGYSTYSAEGATPAAKDERETFYHRYMLGYQGGGRIAKGKVGEYGYLLGYDWVGIDRHVEGMGDNLASSRSLQRGKLIFDGDLKLQVPGYPIRFSAFSRDTTKNFYLDTGNVERFRGGAGSIIDPVTASVSGGMNISSGMTLDIGLLRNQKGGKYFNDLPRLVLEYRDTYVSDLKSESNQHNRTRSYTGALGKGPVWLRYNLLKYVDYLTGEQPSVSQQFNVGTVDNRLQRTWIDVTNWIRISADGQFTNQRSSNNLVGTSYQKYEVNLFTVAARERWTARNFNYFAKEIDRDDNSRLRTIDTPLYLEGALGIDTDWKARFVSRDKQGTDPKDTQRTLLTSVRVDTFKRSPFTLTPSLTVERISKPEETSLSAVGRVETASTRRFSDRLGLSGAYTATYITKSLQSPSTSENSLQHDLGGKVNYAVTDRFRVYYGQSFSWKNGAAEDAVGESIANNQTGQIKTTSRTREVASGYIQSVSSGGMSWQPTARLNIGAVATADVKKNKGIPLDTVISFSNNIEYVMPEYKFNGRIQYSTRSYDSIRTTDWGATAGAVYTPQKNLESSVRATYSFSEDESNKPKTFAEIKQRLSYTVERAYNTRKLLQLVEESSYQYGTSTSSFAVGEDMSATYKTRRNLTLLANYYPYKNLFIGASSRYSLLDPGSVNEYYYHATVGLEYSKLQAYVDYAYGRRNGTDRRVESRFSANLKKQF